MGQIKIEWYGCTNYGEAIGPHQCREDVENSIEDTYMDYFVDSKEDYIKRWTIFPQAKEVSP